MRNNLPKNQPDSITLSGTCTAGNPPLKSTKTLPGTDAVVFNIIMMKKTVRFRMSMDYMIHFIQNHATELVQKSIMRSIASVIFSTGIVVTILM